MTKQFKEKWLAALRSGKYKQGRGRLYGTRKNENGETVEEYCCLGVAVMCKKGFKKEDIRGRSMPSEVKVDLKLKVDNNVMDGIKRIGFCDVEMYLVHMNDKGKSFKQIANWIEKNVN